jgi:hypothetical protein
MRGDSIVIGFILFQGLAFCQTQPMRLYMLRLKKGILEAFSFRDLNYIEVLVVSIKVHTSPYAEQD